MKPDPKYLMAALFPEVARKVQEVSTQEDKDRGAILKEAWENTAARPSIHELKEHQQYLDDIHDLKTHHAKGKHDFEKIEEYPWVLEHQTERVYFNGLYRHDGGKIQSVAYSKGGSVAAYIDLLLRKHFQMEFPPLEKKEKARSLAQAYHATNNVGYRLRLLPEDVRDFNEHVGNIKDPKLRARLLSEALRESLSSNTETLCEPFLQYLLGKKQSHDEIFEQAPLKRKSNLERYDFSIPQDVDEAVSTRVDELKERLDGKLQETEEFTKKGKKRKASTLVNITKQKYAAFVLDNTLRDLSKSAKANDIFGPELRVQDVNEKGKGPENVRVEAARRDMLVREYGKKIRSGRVAWSEDGTVIHHHVNGSHPPIELHPKELPPSVLHQAEMGSEDAVHLQWSFGKRLIDTGKGFAELSEDQKRILQEYDLAYRTAKKAVSGVALERAKQIYASPQNGLGRVKIEAPEGEEIATKMFLHTPDSTRKIHRFSLDVLPESVQEKVGNLKSSGALKITLQLGEDAKFIDQTSAIPRRMAEQLQNNAPSQASGR